MAGIVLYLIFLSFNLAWATPNINLAQLEFISNHLSETDCRQLVASLRSPNYELNPRYVQEGLKFPETTACIQLLAEWASEQDRDKILEQLVRRLRQLNHSRLSKWLSKTSFKNSELELRKSFAAAKLCRSCRGRNTTESTTLMVEKEEVEKEQVEKEQIVETVVDTEGEFVLNETILDRLKKLVPDKKVGLEIALGIGVLIATLLLLWSINMLVKWCLKWRSRRKAGYRSVEFRFLPGNAEEIDFDEEFRKYCKC